MNCRLSRPMGFSLLEMTLAVGVFALLMGGIFGLASGSLELTADVRESGENELARQRFLELCRSHLEDLPGSASLEVRTSEAVRDSTANQLFFFNHPLAFNFGSELGTTHSVVLATEPDGAGTLMAKAHYLDGRGSEAVANGQPAEQNAIRSLILLRGIRLLQWKAFDPRAQQWQTEWSLDSERPQLVALTFQLATDRNPTRSLVWIPPRRSPVSFNSEPKEITEDDENSAETEPVDPNQPTEPPLDPNSVPQN